jgi:hypothetical protein
MWPRGERPELIVFTDRWVARMDNLLNLHS